MSFWKPVRWYQQRYQHRIRHIEVAGLHHLQDARRAGSGVLVTPNHVSHADCYLLIEALRRLHCKFHIMTAWQVFFLMQRWQRLAYRHHGCFSVDREGQDLSAFRHCVRVLATTSQPLVVFPEGEVYHLGASVTRFRDGTFSIASTAVKKSSRPVACVPCALSYRYVDDPIPDLLPVILTIERKLELRSAVRAAPAERVERIQEATLAWRERTYLGAETAGPCELRRDRLADQILGRIERQFAIAGSGRSVPERAKVIRQCLIKRGELTTQGGTPPAHIAAALHDVSVTVQLYSYRFGYVRESPSVERLAETVDKLEEDILEVPSAGVRGVRQGTITFGEPLRMERPCNRAACRALGEEIRGRIQSLLLHAPIDDRAVAAVSV